RAISRDVVSTPKSNRSREVPLSDTARAALPERGDGPWVFNRGGDLAYAFNYGEISPAMLTQAITDAASDWHHD
ncbi:MAG: hypothetical protein AAFQ43_14095, partial [Bacteroidota bacterium]